MSKQQSKKPNPPAKNAPAKKQVKAGPSFTDFLLKDKKNRLYLIIGLAIGVFYAILLHQLFPKPSFYFDSGTYIEAARDHQAVSFRPLGYSDFISALHDFYNSSTFLVMLQYATNVIANLFLFFSLLYFFPLPKWAKITLFVLLTCNPLYPLYSNYILSEGFFCGFTVMWFGVLLWVMQRPNWYNFVAQVVLLLLLFKLRYNAIMYPVFTSVALLLSIQPVWKKALGIVVSFFVIFVIVKSVTNKTEVATGVRVFSAFGGWQMASNAENVIKHTDVDPNNMTTLESRELCVNSKNYFAALAKLPPDTSNKDEVSAVYLWDPRGPLKQYIPIYMRRKSIPTYFKAWTELGPVFSDFGKEIILNYPVQFVKYFVWPNTKLYWEAPLEAYEKYNQGKDSVDKTPREYYHYTDSKVSQANAGINNGVMHAWKFLFPVVNALFLLLLAAYFVTGAYKRNGQLFLIEIAFMVVFYISNFMFAVFLAPTVFRYHVATITLCLTFIVYLISYIFRPVKPTS